MPIFLDLYVSRLREKRDEFKKIIESVLESPLDEKYSKWLRKLWNPLPLKRRQPVEVFAVDSSGATRELYNGAIIHICRALGLSNRGKEERDLDIEMFYYCGNDRELNSYLGMRREFLEFNVAYNYVKNVEPNDERKLILIDGSLYGRLMHIPKDAPVSHNRDFMIKYMELYHNLMCECLRRDVWIIGVSKDSRANFLREYILCRIIDEILSSLDDDLKARVNEFLSLSRRKTPTEVPPDIALAIGDESCKNIKWILNELINPKPDYQLLLAYLENSGYTSPIIVRGRRHGTVFSHKIDLEKYVDVNFEKSIMLNYDVREKALDILRKMTNFPAIISYYIIFEKGDIPLRIDVPAWVLGLDKSISDVEQSEVIESKETIEVIREITSILMLLYSGKRHYNVLLERVDEKVRLRTKVVDEIYEKILEKELGTVVLHSRGYRRVKYP